MEVPHVHGVVLQDLNGDGIHQWPNDGGDLVYAEMRKPAEELTLGGAGSIWLTNQGGAECWAMLYAYGWKGWRRVDPSVGLLRFPRGGLRPSKLGRSAKHRGPALQTGPLLVASASSSP